MILGSNNNMNIRYKNILIRETQEVKIVGVTFDKSLNFENHINNLRKKANPEINYLQRLRHFNPRHILNLLYRTTILPSLTYSCHIWGYTYKSHILNLERLHNRAARIISDNFTDRIDLVLKKLNWLQFKNEISVESLFHQK